MGKKEDIMAEFENLKSDESRIDFLMTRTLLSRERTEALDRYPWPIHTPRGFEGMDQHLEAVLQGKGVKEDGTNHLASLDAYTQMLDLEAEEWQRRIDEITTGKGVDAPPPPEWEPDERLTDHIQEIMTLSGESYDTVSDFYLAYLAYKQRLNDLVGQFAIAQQEEIKGVLPKGKG